MSTKKAHERCAFFCSILFIVPYWQCFHINTITFASCCNSLYCICFIITHVLIYVINSFFNIAQCLNKSYKTSINMVQCFNTLCNISINIVSCFDNFYKMPINMVPCFKIFYKISLNMAQCFIAYH